jgi:uncharacterized repeat protein (TIGR02543 family)
MYPGWTLFSTAGGSVPVDIDVAFPCPWTMDGDVDFDQFASVNHTSGIGDGQFMLTAPRNSDPAMREGRGYLVEHGTYNVLVYQAGTGDVPINVAIAGGGAGTVECPYINALWDASGIEYTLDIAQAQDFIAAADQGNVFTGWTGDCTTTTATCSLPLNLPINLTATFEPEAPTSYLLSVDKMGEGSVVSNPSGINCGVGCSSTAASFASNAQVTLAANPGVGKTQQWAGDCTGAQATCVVAMSADRTVMVEFVDLPAEIFVDGFESGGTSAWSLSGGK